MRYVVTETGTKARPFQVLDTKGGWVCSGHKSLAHAQDRVNELNKESDPSK
jgi:hypothetical protein